MPTAEVIAIGTELLLGQIQDTNTSYIARTLNESGIDIFRAAMIGDNEARIASLIREALERTDIIITTGGLGPTVDDPTRAAVALAFGVENRFHAELWDQIQERYETFGRKPSENNKRQAYLPDGAAAITNPVGTAPAFFVEIGDKILFSLPGVPAEMKTLLYNDVIPKIRVKYSLESAIVVRVLHTIGLGESRVDEQIGDLEKLNNPTVGLSAHPGQVDVRITAKARTKKEARSLIKPVERQVERQLGNYVYGKDEQTIQEVVNQLLDQHAINLHIFFHPEHRGLAAGLSEELDMQVSLEEIPRDEKPDTPADEHLLVLFFKNQRQADHGVDLQAKIFNNTYEKKLRFGAHPSIYDQWMTNQILGFIREIIIDQKGVK